jgi:hypothetical protein
MRVDRDSVSRTPANSSEVCGRGARYDEDMADQKTRSRASRQRTLKLRDGRRIPIRESKLKTPEERVAATERIAGSIKTDVIVDRSFYRGGRW